MNDLHADEVAPRAALPPQSPVARVSARPPSGATNGILLGIVAVTAAVGIAAATTAIIHAGTISRSLIQGAAQGAPGATKPLGHSDGDGDEAFHGCEPASDARFAHREWARLPHDGGRP